MFLQLQKQKAKKKNKDHHQHELVHFLTLETKRKIPPLTLVENGHFTIGPCD